MGFGQYLSVLTESALFAGMDADGILRLLACVGASETRRPAGGIFVTQGDAHSNISVVLEGRAVGQRLTADGSVVTVSEFAPGDVFGDVLSGSSQASIVSVTAKTDCAVLGFSFDNILTCCENSRQEQIILLRNLINAIADKFFRLNERVSVLAQGSLRGKVASYLVYCAEKSNGDVFEIPHNREEMAQYLSCERSALSRELSRMAAQGLIRYNKQHFEIRDRQAVEWLAQ